MTTAIAIRTEKETARWCRFCGHVTYGGSHRADGSFDPSSVEVTDREIMLAVIRSPMSKSESTTARRAKARYAIALGKHSGVYQPE